MAYTASAVFTALALTFLGAAGTAVGGLLVVFQTDINFRRLGVLQGLAAGLMLCLSFVDLLPAAINIIGFPAANIWFFSGVAFFAAIVALIPEDSLGAGVVASSCEEDTPPSSPVEGKGGLMPPPLPTKGVKKERKQVMMSGIITALGIALHNFPEGIAVFLASLKGTHVGLSLALAIALHNIPEGVAVALPVYFASKSRMVALRYAVISGLAEPLGVVIVVLLVPSGSLSEELVEGLLAAVGGIMAFLTFHELLPLAMQHAGKGASVAAVFVGMALMSVSLHFLDVVLNNEGGHGGAAEVLVEHHA